MNELMPSTDLTDKLPEDSAHGTQRLPKSYQLCLYRQITPPLYFTRRSGRASRFDLVDRAGIHPGLRYVGGRKAPAWQQTRYIRKNDKIEAYPEQIRRARYKAAEG